MPLPTGTRLGVYEIVGPLGAGGMGEVYRAHDSRLGRDVAIKVLPDRSLSDSDAIVRLQREARAASALNHPHILTIYDIGRTEGDLTVDYIAMEYIEGTTMYEWIATHPPIESVVEALVQLADGLAKAHEAGIIHRDLKPANVMITRDGYAKILDFGLARSGSVQPVDDEATTQALGMYAAASARDLTQEGKIVGTIGYIAPERFRGSEATARSDIFAFGCVIYEAVTGQRAFDGSSAFDTLQLLGSSDPAPLRASNPKAPPELQRIVSQCLRKDPQLRYATMRDIAVELRKLHDRLRGASPRPPARLTQVSFDRAIEQFPTLSADGTKIVFSREVGRVRNLFLADLTDGSERRLTDGAFDDLEPVLSPAGDALLFIRGREAEARLQPGDVFGQLSGGDVWRLDLETGSATRLLDDAGAAAWSPDGSRIAFDASYGGARRIWIADARGRNLRQVTSDHSNAVVHYRPRWSPDGRRIVFQNQEGTKYDIRVVDTADGALRWVTNDHTMDLQPAWSPDGEWIYFSSYRGGGINLWRIPVDEQGHPIGMMEQVTAGPGQDVNVAIAPNGKMAIAILKQNADIWRLPVDPDTGEATGPPEPVASSTRENSRGAWSADGTKIAFNSDRGGEMHLWIRDGGSLRQVTRGSGGDFQANWSPDGAWLTFFSGRSGALDIWRVATAAGEPERLTRGDGISINPFFSPDGSQIAFMSDRDGALDVWVMNADGTQPVQLTTCGVMGHFLRWTVDGQHIVFRCPSAPKATTMMVALSGGAPVETPEVIGGSHMSLSPDDSMVMDVVAHRTLWVSPLHGGAPRRVFEFDDAESRIDYPVWSPDGRWILFDRFVPHGGDLWTVEL
jgi:Tol biopolymer transport system component/tRNA A-37 threonylcarbamoyl transferase component Bud32